ncbi:sulfotransferase [Nocardioides salsibiostraticola]
MTQHRRNNASGTTRPTRVIYISGTGRSGSTLVGNAVGSLPGALSVGEVKLGFRRGLVDGGFCGCRELVRECPVWVPALEATFGSVPDPARAALLDERLAAAVRTRTTPWWLARRTSSEVEELTDTLGSLLVNLAVHSGSETVVDSSKLPAYGALIDRSPDLDVYVVHVVRDPRAVAWSWQRHAASSQVSGYEEELERFGPSKSSLMWLESSSSTAALTRRSGRPAHVVRYEDFVQRPRDVLSGIAAFAGLPGHIDLSKLVDDEGLHLRPSHAVAGNPNRVRSGPVTLRLDDEWEHALPRNQRRLVSAITAPRRRSHGY